MPGSLHVYLVPGFFGFVNFGELVYYSHVAEFLSSELSARGRRVHLHRVTVSPTSSIKTRATELYRHIADSGFEPDDSLHILGHSTGGLDARLLLSPGVTLDPDLPDIDPVASRIESLVTVSAPHRGTPLATFFTGMLGQRLLRLLSLFTITLLREGRLPLAILARAGSILGRLWVSRSKSAQLLDHLYDELLGQLPAGQRDEISQFLSKVHDNTDLLPQLTPAAIDLFNASTSDRPTTRYACVVTRSPEPSLRQRWDIGLDPVTQAQYAIFQWLHGRCGFERAFELPQLEPGQRQMFLDAYGRVPGGADNDGIVPSLSQLHGELLFAAQADHLDVIGHFDDEAHVPPHRDWLATHSQFTRGQFEALWTTVADFICPAC